MSGYPASKRILGRDVLSGIAEHLAGLAAPRALALVCDDNLYPIAGVRIRDALAATHDVSLLTLGRTVRPTHEYLERVIRETADAGMILALGSGTINDICKAAATERNIPYISIATAASMNGYCSASASIESPEAKMSLWAHPPVAVIADMSIIANAPRRMTRAGIGDTLCRPVVEADMMMSHYLLGTPYPKGLFDAMRKHETLLVSGTINNRGEEERYITTLMEALLDTGDAMRQHGSSAVASQGEHMIAHTLEIKYGAELYNILHGELVALASLTSSQLQHRMLLSVPIVKTMPCDEEQFIRLFGKQRTPAIMQAYRTKILSSEQVAEINARLPEIWPKVCHEIQGVMMTTKTLERALIHNGLSTQPEQMGIDTERYRFGASYAHLTRERFTFLDLAAMNTKRVIT